MNFKCRTLEQYIFFVDMDTVELMIDFINNYEKENSTLLRVCCSKTGKRIIGGILQ